MTRLDVSIRFLGHHYRDTVARYCDQQLVQLTVSYQNDTALVSQHQSTQGQSPTGSGQNDSSSVSLDPLLQQQLGLVLLLGKETSGLLGVKVGGGRLVVGVRVERVGSLGGGLLREREKGLVQWSDYYATLRVSMAT